MMDQGPGERLPPFNKEAEQGLLGSLLRENNVIHDVLQILHKPEYFYSDAHQKIFQAIVALYDKGNPIDLVTLHNYLVEHQQTEEIGGPSYLSTLWEAAPTAANAEFYARIVRDKGIIRHLIRATTEVLRDSYDQVQPADELLGAAERRILEIAQMGATGETLTLQQALHEAFARIDARADKRDVSISGVPSGFVDLDETTAGFQSSELIIIAARPSVGKTAFALNIVRHVAVDANLPVFFVSLEQSRTEIAERLLCCQSGVNSQKIRSGHLARTDFDRLLEAGETLNQAKLFIDDAPGQSMLRIAASSRRLKQREDLKLVVIDYLQLIEPDNRKESRQEQVASISRRLKHLARELKIPVISCAQLNRGTEDRQDHRPRLSDLRESGSIEQDADTVMMLHRPEYYNPEEKQGVVEVIVGKQRNGPTGEVTLAFIKELMRFENFAVEPPFTM